ncbi:hypothetical protein [Longispora albida]|uniref:hypothetical protein n=1 Tax=Longispora albida TaxID=203523 RepID=UPI00035CD416|nr:hypothetical protein [Longispora albida]
MPDETIDLIVVVPSQDDEGYGIYSPQIPGLVGGRASMGELRDDLGEILTSAGLSPHVGVRIHTEQVFLAGEAEYLVRVLNDACQEERLHIADRINAVMAEPGERDALLEGPTTRTGEVLFICVVASDRIGDVAAQLHPQGDVAVLVTSVADNFICSTRISNSPDLLENAQSAEELGFSSELTVGELMRAAALGLKPRHLLVA